MVNTRNRIVAVALLAVALAVPSFAGQKFLGIGRSKTEFQVFKDPNGRFSFEYPKDWHAVPGSGDVIVTFSQKDGEAALVIERLRLNLPIAKDDVTDGFVRSETDLLQQRQPKATNVAAKILDLNDLRMIVFDYNRPGISRPERARQYSIPSGTEDLYFLTCSTGAEAFAKYEPIFSHVAASFKIAPAGSQRP